MLLFVWQSTYMLRLWVDTLFWNILLFSRTYIHCFLHGRSYKASNKWNGIFLYMKKIFVDGKFHTSTLCNAGIPIVFLGFPSGSLDFFWILWISRIPIEFLGFQRFLMDFQGFEVPRIRCFPLISKSPFNRLLL